jgi:hypothetical protein
MNMRGAFEDTLELAEDRHYGFRLLAETGVDMAHLRSMLERVTPEFSEAKLGRWLGYAQGVLVANGCITLDEAKAINMKHAGQ